MLAPDDPKWLHRDDDLKPPIQAWIHRAHYVGPSGGRPADELHGTTGLERSRPMPGSSAAGCSCQTRTSAGH